MKKTGITESQFYMWRAVFALAHADNKVTDEEVRFMAEALEDVPFSKEQKAILTDDITQPKNISDMFKGIIDPRDQAQFFRVARQLAWVDGDFGKEEQAIMLQLQKLQLQNVSVDHMIGNTNLELEDGPQSPREVFFSFREKFLKNKKDQS